MKKDYESFEYEWNNFKHPKILEVDGNEKFFFELVPFDREWLKGKTCIDFGCGAGRYVRVMSKYAKEIIAVEPTEAIYNIPNNKKIIKHQETIEVFTCLSEKNKEKVDFILCTGVLHHTKEPKTNFKYIISNVKKNGLLLISMYPKTKLVSYNTLLKLMRVVTKRLPNCVNKLIVKIITPMFYYRYKTSKQHAKNVIMDLKETEWYVFDILSPKYRWEFDKKEIVKWFEEYGFEKIETKDYGCVVWGWKK